MVTVSKTGTIVSRNLMTHREKEKELHQLRLRLKAVRVQCLLLEFAFPERYPGKSLFVPFREYYQQTSCLRDLTVAQQRFRKICRKTHLPSNGFQNYLWQHYREEEKHLEQLQISDIDAFEQLHRNEIPPEELQEIISQQMLQLMEKMKEAHLNPEITGNLHWQRKQLKKLIYLNRLLPKDSPLWDETITAKLEMLDEKLGAWHDLQVMLQLVGQFAGLHPRGHTPVWLPRITRAIVTEQIRIMESLKDLTK
jgi:CHAD domain-containing protein